MSDEAMTSKMVFLRKLTREEQLGTLYDMYISGNNEDAKLMARISSLEGDVRYLKGELSGVARRHNNPTIDTSQKMDIKIQKAKEAQFDWLAWFRDKVLPNIVTLITLAVLYMAFGGKLP